MKSIRNPPFGAITICMVYTAMIFSKVNCEFDSGSVTPSAAAPPHRGAARQMYGSGSLRPAGSKPIFATGQRNQGVRTTLSPSLQSSHKIIPMMQPYLNIPFALSMAEYQRMFPNPNIPRTDLPSNRGGMYGGRPEYSNGRPNHGFSNTRNFDFGFLAGKGFQKIKPNYKGHFLGQYPMQRYSDLDLMPDNIHLKHPEEEDEDDLPLTNKDEKYPNPCGLDCQHDEFLCTQSCICISDIDRCDGEMDCGDNEDELECGETDHHSMVCDETNNSVRCPKSGKCISKNFLCDGDDDCGDFSDETRCGIQGSCSSEQFECDNGLCIPKTWVCDNDDDCKDASDEFNCTTAGCTEDQFECGDTSCISIGWKCDFQEDCSDGSDESDCDIIPPYCTKNEFKCNSYRCIKTEFRCDGDDDCGDWSDEDNCPKIEGNCVADEFRCRSGKCIPDRYRCDMQKDCDDNEDEANCDYSTTKTCSPSEHRCDNGACILKTWVCDGYSDCSHSEDEAKCEIVCDESKFACAGHGKNVTEFCIGKKHVCDGQKDCPDGEDEENCPTKRECEQATKCKQLCITTSDGKFACSCFPGYYLMPDGYTCEDVNECLYATDPVCSQTCTNTIGSFNCSCMTGYILRPDLRSCKALGDPPTLLFANRIDIRQVSLSNSKYTAIFKGLHNAIALDYHYEKGLIFWSDISMHIIRNGFVNGTGVQDIVKWGLESPSGVAIDWIHNLIFWTDYGTRRIEVSSLDGLQRAIIAANDIDKPRAIAVHPGEALVFWTDWGPFPKIEKAEMDGSNRKSIITESVFWPNGLTLDYTTNRIYWADAKHNVIETALFDGSDRRKVISKGLPHPFAITIFEDHIYWTDWHTKAISTANKATGAGFKTIHPHLHFPMDIHTFHPQRQPKYQNHCGDNNGGCAHMCIPNQKSFTCVCRMDQKLNPDKKTCQTPDKFLLFARKKDLRIKHLDSKAVHQYEMVIPVDGIKSAVAIAWDSKTDYIYWTDVERDTINRAYWNGSNQEAIITSTIVSPAGIALDWITDKIYWTDSVTARIEVANTDGQMRSLLIWEDLDTPRDIVVDPLGGYMYWSNWGDKKKIERADMDGTNRIIIANNNLTWPNGLAVDHETGKIYWADGGTRAIEYANFNGTDRRVLLEGKNLPHPFGLDVFEDFIYWTDWSTLKIEKANKFTGQNRSVLSSGMKNLMDVRLFHRNRKYIETSCNINNGGCTHLCLLKPNKGHSCACPTGVKLAADGKTCANGPTNFLIMAHRMDIRQISLDVPYMADVVLPFPQVKMAASIDVDRKTGEIYWTDTAQDVIQKGTSDGKKVETVLMHELESPDGIAVDSTGRKIYWTDGERNSIEVAELDGTNRKVLFYKNLDNPRAITLHYFNGLMFWSDWGKQAKIEMAHMDGTHRKTLIGTRLTWPNGLAIDRPANRLYWNDGKLHTIESSDLNGNDRRVIINNVSHPYGLVVVGAHIYWTDWETRALHRADKLNGEDRTTIVDKLEGLMDVRSVQNDNIEENACGQDNGGCSHLCLRNPSSFKCACPTGIKFKPGSTTQCEALPSTYLLVATRYALSRISLDTPEVWDTTLKIDGIHNVINVDYHWEKKLIFYTDIDRNAIESVSMHNLSDVKLVANQNLSSPESIAVDWIADNIYWTNSGKRIIEVARLDGSKRKTVVWKDLQDPRSVVVFPSRGYLFWTDWSTVPKIERSYTDGSGRKVLFNTDLTFPIGLTLDYETKRLYWLDAKLNEERVETCDINGQNRVIVNIHDTHPFSLTQFGDYLYWTDWVQKSVNRTDKTTGKDSIVVRPQLDAAMGLTMVTTQRQQGWNPCRINNGGCTDLCFFRRNNYTCGCPEVVGACKLVPKTMVSLQCPTDNIYKCDYDLGDEDENLDAYPTDVDGHEFSSKWGYSNLLYITILVPMLCILLLCIGLAVYLLVKKGKKKYLYTTGRSFSNPNYYSSSNNESNGSTAQNTDRKQFLWKRLKYDKSQERVYEETTGTNSPEIASLIPTILTPCSSNCETVTPELERSPSVTPLHKMEVVQPVV